MLNYLYLSIQLYRFLEYHSKKSKKYSWIHPHKENFILIDKAVFRFDPSTHREVAPSLFKYQERMFSTSKVLSKEQMEELEKNPFFDKYKDKIAQLQK